MESNTNPILPGTPIDLDKVISESKEALAHAEAPKRGRGRPKGWRKQTAENGPVEDKKDDFKSVEGVVLKENEIEPLAGELVKAPFDIIGWKTGINVTPTDEEAVAPKKYAAKLIECYLPDLDAKDPKTFNLIALVISYALLAIKKLRVFAEKKREQQKNEKPPQAEPVQTDNAEIIIEKTQANKPLPENSMPAENFFRR